jgi:hypothetical protein
MIPTTRNHSDNSEADPCRDILKNRGLTNIKGRPPVAPIGNGNGTFFFFCRCLPASRPAFMVNGAMPRTARASIGGICHTFLNRGNTGQDVLHVDDGLQRFIELFQEACARAATPRTPTNRGKGVKSALVSPCGARTQTGLATMKQSPESRLLRSARNDSPQIVISRSEAPAMH